MCHSEDQNNGPLILDSANDSEALNTVTPKTAFFSFQRFAETSRVGVDRDARSKIFQDVMLSLMIKLA